MESHCFPPHSGTSSSSATLEIIAIGMYRPKAFVEFPGTNHKPSSPQSQRLQRIGRSPSLSWQWPRLRFLLFTKSAFFTINSLSIYSSQFEFQQSNPKSEVSNSGLVSSRFVFLEYCEHGYRNKLIAPEGHYHHHIPDKFQLFYSF